MKTYFAALLFFSLSLTALSSSNEKYSIQSTSNLSLKGTSTLHNYECTAANMRGNVEMDYLRTAFVSAEITIPVADIHSGTSGLDDNMYDALKAKQFPEIRFVLMHADSSARQTGTHPDSIVVVNGSLTIAGKQNMIELAITVKHENNGTIVVRGTKKLRMTDYGIDPPSFMLGVLKAGNDVDIDFTIVLFPSQSPAQLLQTK